MWVMIILIHTISFSCVFQLSGPLLLPVSGDKQHSTVNGLDVNEVRCAVVDWIQLAQDRDEWRNVVNTVMNFRVT
jgi:hypothetical protein